MAKKGEFVFDEVWLKKGIQLYNEYNSETKRKPYEDAATAFMSKRHSQEEYIDYLQTDFLKWMQSRSKRALFCEDLKKVLSKERYNRIFETNPEKLDDIKALLQEFCLIRGVGPVLATAMITLIDPKNYGIVCKYTVSALQHIYPQRDDFGSESIRKTVKVIDEMRLIRQMLGGEHTTREVDMALWGYGKKMFKRD